MTAAEVQQFADVHGLSTEEAEVVLRLRDRKPLTFPMGDRLGKAKAVLEQAQRKVGVHPVAEVYDELVKTHDPEAEVGEVQFYKTKFCDPGHEQLAEKPRGWVGTD